MIKYAIVGTGGMAHVHAEKLLASKRAVLTCACDIDAPKARAFAEKHGIPEVYTDFEEMLRKGDFSALSVVTIDSTHADLSLRAIAAGKHVLCEKPLATQASDALKMASAAREAGVTNMVNFSYRNSSAWQRAREILERGDLGRLFHFQAHYLQSWLTSKNWGVWHEQPAWLWRLSKKHGSNGALGDIGVHLVDFATGLVGPVSRVFCHLTTFDKAPDNRIGDYQLDANDSAQITLACKEGPTGTLAITRCATGHQNSIALSIHGEKGALRLDLDASYEMLEICRLDDQGLTQPWERLYCGKTPSIYERFLESIMTGQQDQPDFARGAEVQQILDACATSAERETLIRIPG